MCLKSNVERDWRQLWDLVTHSKTQDLVKRDQFPANFVLRLPTPAWTAHWEQLTSQTPVTARIQIPSLPVQLMQSLAHFLSSPCLFFLAKEKHSQDPSASLPVGGGTIQGVNWREIPSIGQPYHICNIFIRANLGVKRFWRWSCPNYAWMNVGGWGSPAYSKSRMAKQIPEVLQMVPVHC